MKIICTSASYILGPLKSRLSREMGTDNTEFSLLISAFSLNSTWTPLVGGVLASRLGTTFTSILATGVVFLGADRICQLFLLLCSDELHRPTISPPGKSHLKCPPHGIWHVRVWLRCKPPRSRSGDDHRSLLQVSWPRGISRTWARRMKGRILHLCSDFVSTFPEIRPSCAFLRRHSSLRSVVLHKFGVLVSIEVVR